MKNLFTLSSKNPLVFMLAFVSFFMFGLFMKDTIIPLFTQDTATYKNNAAREDFVRVYVGARVAAFDSPATLYNKEKMTSYMKDQMVLSDEQIEHITAWLYPPVWFLMLQPLAYLSYKAAFIAWLAVNMGIFYAAGYGFVWRKPVEALLIWSPAVFAALSWGQNGVLTAALYLAAFRFLFTAPALSGIMFGLCIIKPQLGLLVPFFLLFGRHYKVMVFAGMSASLFILLSIFSYGFEPWTAYIHTMMQGGKQLELSMGYAMPSVYNFERSFGIPDRTSALFQALVFVTAILSLWIIRKTKNRLQLLTCLSAFTLLSFPYFGIYDYVLMTTAFLGMLNFYNPNKRIDLLSVISVITIYMLIILHPIALQVYGVIIVPALLFVSSSYLQSRFFREAE